MKQLVCSLLGTPLVQWTTGTPLALPTRREMALLIYLMVEQERAHRRETLMTLLWPHKNDTVARRNLRQTLFRLRKALEADANPAEPFLLITPTTLQFNPNSPHFLDLKAFLRHLEAVHDHPHNFLATCPDCLPRLEQAVNLYQGDFLTGFDIASNPAFEEWLAIWRERLHRQVLEALHQITQSLLQRSDYAGARHYARRQIEMEPWREEAHRQMMEALARSGHLSEARQQYQACRRILEREFGLPPEPETQALYQRLHTLSHIPQHNFPAPVTPFIGRNRELTEVGALLARPDVRLVSIVGFGGVGKTRLAMQVARQERHRFLDGVVFLPLADLQHADDIPLLITSILQIPSQAQGTPHQRVVHFLQPKEMLLVLDNCEHLPGCAPWISNLLTQAPQIKALVTSREALHLRGEWVYLLEGMISQGEPTPDATRLFIQRIRQINPLFQDSDEERSAIRDLCRLLDGNPLAIELAAATLSFNSVSTLYHTLADNITALSALSTSWRDLPERQRSLEATLKYSWRLLSSDEQRALRRLAVFRGNFSTEAACAITLASPQTLVALERKSLLRRLGDGRYNLHPLVRQFAAGQLHASPDEAAEVAQRHAAWFLNFLHRHKTALLTHPTLDVRRTVAQVMEEVFAAWEWAVEHRAYDLIRQAAEGLDIWCDLRGWYHQGLQAFQRAIQALAEDPATASSPLRARLEGHLGMVLYLLGDLDSAERHLQHGLRLLRQDGKPADVAFLLNRLGVLNSMRGDFDAAEACFQESLHLRREADLPLDEVNSLNNLGIVARSQGDLERARALTEESLAVARRTGFVMGVIRAVEHLGLIAFAEQNYAQAKSWFEQNVRLFEELGSPWGQALSLGNLGATYLELGQHEQANSAFRKSLQLRREIGDRWGEAEALQGLGNVARATGQPDHAVSYFVQALEVAASVPSHTLCLEIMVNLAAVWMNGSEPYHAQARTLLQIALTHPACEDRVRQQAQQLWQQGEPADEKPNPAPSLMTVIQDTLALAPPSP